MSASLIEERNRIRANRTVATRSTTTRRPVVSTVASRIDWVKPRPRNSQPAVLDDEEMHFYAKVVIGIAILATLPSVLFHIIAFFFPHLFM